jgi:hypothetical protein
MMLWEAITYPSLQKSIGDLPDTYITLTLKHEEYLRRPTEINTGLILQTK